VAYARDARDRQERRREPGPFETPSVAGSGCGHPALALTLGGGYSWQYLQVGGSVGTGNDTCMTRRSLTFFTP
jgi:hypothetical protein